MIKISLGEDKDDNADNDSSGERDASRSEFSHLAKSLSHQVSLEGSDDKG